jgi:hypothetical protein
MPTSHALGGEHIEVLPLTVVTQAFPARPSALPDVRDFVRRQLSATAVSDDDVRSLCERVAEVLLEVAGVAGNIQVSMRIVPGSAEVDVLFAPDHAETDRGTGIAGPPDRGALIADLRPRPAQPVTAEPDAASRGSGAPSFAVWLSGRLRSEGMTMEAAARRLDVSTKTISRWVGGTTEPRLRDLYRIRDVFGEPPFH